MPLANGLKTTLKLSERGRPFTTVMPFAFPLFSYITYSVSNLFPLIVNPLISNPVELEFKALAVHHWRSKVPGL